MKSNHLLKTSYLSSAIAGIVFALSMGNLHAILSFTCKDFVFDFGAKTNIGVFEGKNISLLNECNNWDHILYIRQTVDFSAHVNYGAQSFGYPVVEAHWGIRNKSLWGDPQSIASTTDADIKLGDALIGSHSHFIPRQLFWMKEGWVDFSIGDVLCIPLRSRHTLTAGYFSFYLGRGISLGDAYAVGPDILGFYSDLGAVDQYAPAIKLSGVLVEEDVLSYDFYVAMLQNKAGTLGDTGAKIRGQEYGRLKCPWRGFGRINWLFAARLNWNVFDCDNYGSLSLEPYGLYNDDPEQFVEFTADAESKLATFGLAGEYETDRFAFGFDTAVNVGRQHVRGWDRNIITIQNRNGVPVQVNSHVVLNIDPADPVNEDVKLTPYQLPYSPSNSINSVGVINDLGKQAQKLIDDDLDAAGRNGKLLGIVNGISNALPFVVTPAVANAHQDGIYNMEDRYRDPYNNRYKGAMGVADAAVFFWEKELEWAVTGGFATGDANPNNQRIDGDYRGFIPLQEIYSGKRVRSAFVLGGAGKLKRPLSVPTDEDPNNEFADVVSGFTDLAFVGTSIRWESRKCPYPFSLQPNFLAYWKYDRVNKFDAFTKEETNERARNFLGAELNLFAHIYPVTALKFYFVGSVFIPGAHYKDIQGKPLNKEQAAALDRLDRTGFNEDRIPNIGTDTAFTFSIGLEFSF